MRCLIIDNYDSFTYNLFQAIGELGARPVVARNDALTLEDVAAMSPDRIVLSPGPGRPERREDFGVCGEVIRHLGARIPILGICLGHQGIVTVGGGRVIAAPRPVHGQTSRVERCGDSVLLRGLPPHFEAMRYHSLIADPESLPVDLRVTARADGIIMAIEHRRDPIYGIQFHPESIGTPLGQSILGNFLDRDALSLHPEFTTDTLTDTLATAV